MKNKWKIAFGILLAVYLNDGVKLYQQNKRLKKLNVDLVDDFNDCARLVNYYAAKLNACGDPVDEFDVIVMNHLTHKK